MYVDNLKKQQQQCLNPVGFKNLNNYSLTINTYPNQKHPGASTLRQIIPMNYKLQLNESFLLFPTQPKQFSDTSFRIYIYRHI